MDQHDKLIAAIAPAPSTASRGRCIYCGEESQNQTEADSTYDERLYVSICGPAHMGAGAGEGYEAVQEAYELIENHGDGHACTCLDDDGEECELGDCKGAVRLAYAIAERILAARTEFPGAD